ncbi:MAG: ubiquinol oxidase subunit II, partial [Betaproteobacteria bacterium]
PLLIIIALGALTWIGTHTLDPYRSLTRIDAERPVPRNVEPLNIEVVALDWKWLFIYPDQNIAVVNELAAPVDTPIHFKITASSVMNSFFVPALAGQIYAMPSMATSLHAVINRTGEYAGFSANYSGAGFSDMRFKFLGMSAADFDRWMQKAKAGGELSRGSYIQLEQPSEREPVRRYGAVAPDLFDAIVNRCVDQGKMCLREMMAMDAHRPSGRQSAREPIALNLGLDAAVCRADNSAAADLLPSVYRD